MKIEVRSYWPREELVRVQVKTCIACIKGVPLTEIEVARQKLRDAGFKKLRTVYRGSRRLSGLHTHKSEATHASVYGYQRHEKRVRQVGVF